MIRQEGRHCLSLKSVPLHAFLKSSPRYNRLVYSTWFWRSRRSVHSLCNQMPCTWVLSLTKVLIIYFGDEVPLNTWCVLHVVGLHRFPKYKLGIHQWQTDTCSEIPIRILVFEQGYIQYWYLHSGFRYPLRLQRISLFILVSMLLNRIIRPPKAHSISAPPCLSRPRPWRSSQPPLSADPCQALPGHREYYRRAFSRAFETQHVDPCLTSPFREEELPATKCLDISSLECSSPLYQESC